jgi:hypothetical protein
MILVILVIGLVHSSPYSFSFSYNSVNNGQNNVKGGTNPFQGNGYGIGKPIGGNMNGNIRSSNLQVNNNRNNVNSNMNMNNNNNNNNRPIVNVCEKLDQKKYNCAGLAFQTCTFMGDRFGQVEPLLSTMKGIPCSQRCLSLQYKVWYWPHDLATYTRSTRTTSKSHKDFHIVAGKCGIKGEDPIKVISKNGPRILEKPNTPGFFEPRDGDNFRGVDGKKQNDFFEIITNKRQLCYCTDTLPGMAASANKANANNGNRYHHLQNTTLSK